MNAREAKELADRASKNIVDTEVHDIFGSIRKAAAAGGNRVTITGKKISKKTADHLSVLGYSVEHYSDQREGDYYDIRW